MEEESNGELAFLYTLLKQNNGEISALVYRSLHMLTNTYTTALTTKQVARKVLKENGFQENIISKIFKRITNNHSLPQSQQLMQATDIQEEEIRMSIN